MEFDFGREGGREGVRKSGREVEEEQEGEKDVREDFERGVPIWRWAGTFQGLKKGLNEWVDTGLKILAGK